MKSQQSTTVLNCSPEKIFILIPAYNESQVIAKVLSRFDYDVYNVVVIDDGSTDDTWNIIIGFPVHALRHPINMGQGAALQTGIEYALLKNATILVTFDADGQHDNTEIQSLIIPIMEKKVDVVLGSRFLRKQDKSRVPGLKCFLLKIAVIINRILTGIWLTDAHNGFRALSAKAARNIKIKENGYAHATEILMQIKSSNLVYTEIPTHIVYTDYTIQKGQPMWNALNILFDLIVRKFIK